MAPLPTLAVVISSCLLSLLLPAAEAAYYSRSSRVYIGYTYYGYYYSYHSYFSIGGIAGTVIGALCFTGFVIALLVFFCCIRKRRQMASRQQRAAIQVPMTVGAPVSSVSGQVVVGYPTQNAAAPAAPGYGDGTQHPPPYPTAATGPAAGNNGYQPNGGAVNAGYYGDYSNLPQQQQQQPAQAPPPYPSDMKF